jgi:hypothetical protein
MTFQAVSVNDPIRDSDLTRQAVSQKPTVASSITGTRLNIPSKGIKEFLALRGTPVWRARYSNETDTILKWNYIRHWLSTTNLIPIGKFELDAHMKGCHYRF